MNSVPPQATNQPSSGQWRTSAFDTKRTGCTALTARMSSQEMWFDTNSVAPGRGVPLIRSDTPSAFNMRVDQRPTVCMRCGGFKNGNTKPQINAP